MGTLKEMVIGFIANYFCRIYLTKHKSKSKIRKLRKEIPLSLVEAIEDYADTTNEYHYYRADNEILYLCVVYTSIIIVLTILLFISLIWVSY